MDKINVVTVVGTRPEIIRLSCVIKKLDSCNSVNHILIHTGQNYDYELNEIFFSDLELRKPDYFLDAAEDTPSKTIGRILINIDSALRKISPDALLVLGDTNSCLCTIVAKKLNISIFHMEAGNRCFDNRVPEEINRKLVDHISDINLPYSTISREYLINEGIHPSRIIKTGSPMFEVLNYYKNKINSSNVLSRLSLSKKKYFLISSHRDENINSDNFLKLMDVINKLSINYKFPIIFSAHPRTRNMIKDKKIKFDSLVHILKPLSFTDYNNLQINSKLVLSDSGTISEESSILNFPALNIRDAHERPEAMEEGSVMMVGMNYERIVQGIEILEDQKRGNQRTLDLVSDYSVPNVSEKVLRIIISYKDYSQAHFKN